MSMTDMHESPAIQGDPMADIFQRLEDELLLIIRQRFKSGQEFRISDVYMSRSAAVIRATFRRLERKGQLLAETKISKGINLNKGPGSGKSFFSSRKIRFFRLP